MLCSINTEVGSVATDQKSRDFNFWSSFIAIVTASAGSTPSNKPVNSSGVRNNSYECITVLGNSEGGGWNTGTSNGFGPSATFNASAGANYADIYRTSGKSDYPYYRIAFGHYNAPYNSNFTSYPGLDWSAGCTTSNPSTTTITSAENNWYYGFSSPTSLMTAVGETLSYTNTTDRLRTDQTGKTFYVACTQNYVIIAYDTCLWYWGIRSVGGWELSRTDNPPWVHFSYTRGTNYGTQASQYHVEKAVAWSAGINSSATQQAAALYGHYQQGTGYCGLTGQQENGYLPFYNNFIGGSWNSYKQICLPLFSSPLASNYGPYNYGTNYPFPGESPIADSATGLNVPPVYPVVFKIADYQNNYYATGVVPGIYKGMCTTLAGLNQFVTAASYSIGSDTYIPIRTGTPTYPDLWLLRSA